jgi:hypothetical protein
MGLPPSGPSPLRSRVMYIQKFGGLGSRQGRIGRVYSSKTGRTLHYQGRALQSLNGDGNDPLYPGIVEIDDDVNEEYWVKVRNLPALVGTISYKSLGKYSRSGKREKRPTGALSPKRKKAP